MKKQLLCLALALSSSTAIADTTIPQDVQNDIKSAVSKMALAAVNGNLNELISWTETSDQTRLNSQDSEVMLDKLSAEAQSFTKKIEEDYKVDLGEKISPSTLPISIVSYDSTTHTADVKVGGGSDSTSLKMINEGTMGDAWRVDVSDAITKAQLANSITQMLSNPESILKGMTDISAMAQYKNDESQVFNYGKNMTQQVVTNIAVKALSLLK